MPTLPQIGRSRISAVDGGDILINGFPIDVALSENHAFESDISEYPVESGSDITDNIRPKPVTVTLEGLVSDSPLQVMAQTRGLLGLKAENLIEAVTSEAYLRLLKIRDDREPVTIMTSLDLFESMALKSLSFPRSSGESHGLRFHATFVQIIIVTANRAARVAIPRAAGNGDKGTQVSFESGEANLLETDRPEPIRVFTEGLVGVSGGALVNLARSGVSPATVVTGLTSLIP